MNQLHEIYASSLFNAWVVCVCVFVENPSGGLLWKPHVGKIGLVFSSILVANWHFMIRPGFLEKPSSPHKGS